jgi:hypothetical protein
MKSAEISILNCLNYCLTAALVHQLQGLKYFNSLSKRSGLFLNRCFNIKALISIVIKLLILNVHNRTY